MRVTHFDLKSANILLTQDLTGKVADVGLSRQASVPCLHICFIWLPLALAASAACLKWRRRGPYVCRGAPHGCSCVAFATLAACSAQVVGCSSRACGFGGVPCKSGGLFALCPGCKACKIIPQHVFQFRQGHVRHPPLPLLRHHRPSRHAGLRKWLPPRQRLRCSTPGAVYGTFCYAAGAGGGGVCALATTCRVACFGGGTAVPPGCPLLLSCHYPSRPWVSYTFTYPTYEFREHLPHLL
jgi:hypothetical protein